MTYDHESSKHSGRTLELFVVKNLSKLFGLGLVALATGCGTSAIMTKKGFEPPVDAKIIRGTSDKIYVDTLDVDRLEGETAVPRNEIADIDHPGNVAATVGGDFSQYAIANISVGGSECDEQVTAYCIGVFLPAATGAQFARFTP